MPFYIPITNFRRKDTVYSGSPEKSITGRELYEEFKAISNAINSMGPDRYQVGTNFAVKDSLTTGNTLKKVSGEELDTEFNTIAFALNSIGGNYIPATIFYDIPLGDVIYGSALQDEFDAIKIATKLQWDKYYRLTGGVGAGGTGSGGAGSGGVSSRTTVLEVYQWSISAPTVLPSGLSTYTWIDSTYTLPDTPESWTLAQGTGTTGQVLWVAWVNYSDSDTTATSDVDWEFASVYQYNTYTSSGGQPTYPFYDPAGYGGIGISLESDYNPTFDIWYLLYYNGMYGGGSNRGTITYNYTSLAIEQITIGATSFTIIIESLQRQQLLDIEWIDLPYHGMTLPLSECSFIGMSDPGTSIPNYYSYTLSWNLDPIEVLTADTTIRLEVGVGDLPQASPFTTPPLNIALGTITFVAGTSAGAGDSKGVAPGYYGTLLSNTTGYTVIGISTFLSARLQVYLQHSLTGRLIKSSINSVEVSGLANYFPSYPNFSDFAYGESFIGGTSAVSWVWYSDATMVDGVTYTVTLS